MCLEKVNKRLPQTKGQMKEEHCTEGNEWLSATTVARVSHVRYPSQCMTVKVGTVGT